MTNLDPAMHLQTEIEMHGGISGEVIPEQFRNDIPEVVEAERGQGLLNAVHRAGRLLVDKCASAKYATVTAAQSAIVIAELSPANEAIRLASFGAAQAYAQGPVSGAIAYGASTFLLEGAAAVAAAPLFETKVSDKIFNRLHGRLEKMDVQDGKDIGRVAEITGTLFGGSVVAMAVKQSMDPTRTKEENRRYGVKNAGVLAGVCAVQGAAMAEGVSLALSNPVPAAAVTGTVVAAAGGLWAKRRHNRHASGEEESQQPVIDREATTALYEKVMAEQTVGPQLEGFTPEDIIKVINDERTVFVKNEDHVAWPLLTPITNFSEYLPSYFVERFGGAEDALYVSFPGSLEEFSQEVVAHSIMQALQDGNRLVFDELDGRNTAQQIADLCAAFYPEASLRTDSFVDEKNMTDASVIHYEGFTRIERSGKPGSGDLREAYRALVAEGDASPEDSSDGTVLIDPSRLDAVLPGGMTVFDRLWQIYEGQFTNLVENHPARQMQYRHELEAMINDKDTLAVAHLVEGDIVSFATFVGNIESCDWLNAEYYKNRFGDERIGYFPGIATDENKQGQHFAFNIIDLVSKIYSRANTDVRVVFQCTNISAGYIPAIVKAAVEATGRANVEGLQEMCRYNYRAIELDEG